MVSTDNNNETKNMKTEESLAMVYGIGKYSKPENDRTSAWYWSTPFERDGKSLRLVILCIASGSLNLVEQDCETGRMGAILEGESGDEGEDVQRLLKKASEALRKLGVKGGMQANPR